MDKGPEVVKEAKEDIEDQRPYAVRPTPVNKLTCIASFWGHKLMKKIKYVDKFGLFKKSEKIIVLFLLITSITVGVFALIYFTNSILKTSSDDYVKIQGIVINYESYVEHDNDGNHALYREIVEYSLNGEPHVFKNSNGTGIQPLIGKKYIILYNEKTGEVHSGEYKDRIFPLVFFPAMFILIPFVMIMAIKGKNISYLISGVMVFISLAFITYIANSYNTWNILDVIFNYPQVVISLIMFFAGCYVFIYPLLHNDNQTKYIKVTLTSIENHQIAYFNGGWRTGFKSMYRYKIRDDDMCNFFEVGKVYNVNIAKMGIISNDATNLSHLNKNDFIKLN